MRLKVKTSEREQNSPQYKRFISSVCANKTLAEAELESKLRLPLINNKKLMMLNILWGSREKNRFHMATAFMMNVSSVAELLAGELKSNKAKSIYLFPLQALARRMLFTLIFRQSEIGKTFLFNDAAGTIRTYPLIMRSFLFTLKRVKLTFDYYISKIPARRSEPKATEPYDFDGYAEGISSFC